MNPRVTLNPGQLAYGVQLRLRAVEASTVAVIRLGDSEPVSCIELARGARIEVRVPVDRWLRLEAGQVALGWEEETVATKSNRRLFGESVGIPVLMYLLGLVTGWLLWR